MEEKNKIESSFLIKKIKKNNTYFVHELDLNNLGKAIRELRKERGFTIKQLAKSVGIAESTICELENNTREAKFSSVLKIFKRLHVKAYFQLELQPFWKSFNANKIKEIKKNKHE